MTEDFNGIVLREKEKSLHISRIPTKTKKEFIQFAEEEFSGDYGMLLRELWESYKTNQNLFQGMDSKINYILQILQSGKEKKEASSIKMLDGKSMKGGENK